MLKFLLACYPIPGHLHPNIALGHALRSRGHEVAIYSGTRARAVVETEGFTFFPYHPEMDHVINDVLMPGNEAQVRPGDITTLRAPLFRIRDIKIQLSRWLLSTVPRQVEDLNAAIAQWSPAVLATDISLLGPILILQETQRIPVAGFCVLPACSLPGPDAPAWGRGLPPPRNWFNRLRSKIEGKVKDLILADFRAEVNALRTRYGLSAISVSVTEFSRRLPLHLVAGTPQLDYDRNDLPATVKYIGPCLWHRSEAEKPPRWLEQLRKGRPVVYVTEGTVQVKKPVLLLSAAKGLAGAPVDVIMTTGKHRDAMDLGLNLLAPNIRVEAYISHGDLFPHVDVVVTTGGSGTVLAALIAGIPLVVVPTGWDLPENAQRVAEAGVGIRLNPRRCTPERVRRAVFSVLRTPSYRQRARVVGKALRSRGGPSQGALLLEQLAERVSPEAWTKG